MSNVITYQRFWQRRDTIANWTATNPILAAGEYGVETNSGNPLRYKLGDGTTAWATLAYCDGDDLRHFAAAGGTADAITATVSTFPALVDGMEFHIRASAANATTTPTFNPNSKGALTVYKLGGLAVAAGDIYAAGHEIVLRYRASPARYELLTPAAITGQPLDATLTALAAQNWAANAMPLGSGTDTMSQLALAANTFPARASTGNVVAKAITDTALSLLDDTSTAAMRDTLGVTNAGTLNINAAFDFSDDFITATGTQWTDENTGTGATTVYNAGEVGSPGITRASIGATTARSCQKIAAGLPFMIGGGEIEIEFRLRHSTLATAANNSITIIGLSNVINAGTFTDRVYAQYTHDGTSEVWQIVDQAAGGTVTSTSSTGAGSTTFQRVKLVINAAGTSSELFVDGTSVLTRALSGTFGAMMLVRRYSWVVGTFTRTVDFDYARMRQIFTTAR